jgi:hypothetical protein
VTAVWRKKEGLGEPEPPDVWLVTSYHRTGVAMTLPRKGKDARNEILYGLTLAGCIPRGMGNMRGAGVINSARNKHSPL